MNALRCQMFIFNIHATSVFYTEILLHNLFAVGKLIEKKIIRCIKKETQETTTSLLTARHFSL